MKKPLVERASVDRYFHRSRRLSAGRILPPMLSKHLLNSTKTPTTFVERRQDALTRAVVTGLEELNEHLEHLPHSADRAAALAALHCFAQRVKDALETVNGDAGAGRPEGR